MRILFKEGTLNGQEHDFPGDLNGPLLIQHRVQNGAFLEYYEDNGTMSEGRLVYALIPEGHWSLFDQYLPATLNFPI